jgi:hypothetical protein
VDVGHWLHTLEPSADEKRPKGQARQAEAPDSVMKVPASHCRQLEPFWSEKRPGEHGEHEDDPSNEKVPTSHSEQLV